MRKLTFWLSLALIFIIPWEDSITVEAIGSVARIMGFVVAGCWLMTVLIEGRFRKFRLFHLLMLAFCLWNVLSISWSINTEASIVGAKTYGQIFLLMLILWDLYTKPEELLSGLQAYVLGGFVAIGSTINNYLQGKNISEYEMRFSATGVNAVDLAILLIMGLPLAWHLYVQSRSIYKNPILAFVNLSYIPLALFAVVLTGSRTSLFATVPVGIYILFSGEIKPSTKILALTALAVVMVVLSFYVPQAVVERLGTSVKSVRTADLSGRAELWEKSVAVFKEKPLLGAGGRTLPQLIGSVAHNTFVSVLAETGLVGFILFMAVLVTGAWQAINLPRGYAGVWITMLAVFVIGGSSLTWERNKLTWLVFSFINMQGQVAYEMFHLKRSQKAAGGIAAVGKSAWH